MISEGLYKLLSTAVPIVNLLGDPGSRSDQTTGIFPVQMPKETPMPAIVISQISGSGTPTMDGAEAFHTARYQFSCYGTDFTSAKRLQVTLRRFFEGFHGTLPDGTELDDAQVVLESDGFDEAPATYQAPIDFFLLYRDVGN